MNKNWYWIDLIGFDNTKKDYAVSDFLNRISVKCDGVSLLLYNIDFINMHINEEKECKLTKAEGSYGAHQFNEEGMEIQEWTNFQLRGLITELQKHNVKVLLSYFNLLHYVEDDKIVMFDFCKNNPEIRDINKNGEMCLCVNPLKHLKDGSLYEDYLIAKTIDVLNFYSFDGIQIGDGISSNRFTLENGDFSDDLVSQFQKYSNCSLPQDLLICNLDKKKIKKRFEYIFKNLKYEWIVFMTDRWSDFYKKFVASLCKNKKLITFNNTWTREPFEAIYRYGLDYGKIYDKRMFAMIAEDVACTQPILGDEDQGGFSIPFEERRYPIYESKLTMMSMKAYHPNLDIINLSPVKDTNEQWNLLKHAPTEQERGIYNRNNAYIFKNGKYKRVSQGALYCLSDAVAKSDWEYIQKWENQSQTETVENVEGFVAVFAKSRLYKETKYFIDTRRYTTTKIFNCFNNGGLPICAMADISEIENINAPVLVPNVEFLEENEKAILEKISVPMIVVSVQNHLKRKADFVLNEEAKDGLKCFVYNVKSKSKLSKTFEYGTQKISPFDAHGAIWTSRLKYVKFDAAFFKEVSDILVDLLKLPKIVSTTCDCKLLTFKTGKNSIRIFISNDEYHYSLPRIKLYRQIATCISRTKMKGFPMRISQDEFTTRVPNRGMDIVDITFKD